MEDAFLLRLSRWESPKGARHAALRYSKEREQFGKAISLFQAIAFKLADMDTEIYASELMIRHAGSLKDQGLKVTKESAMAKYLRQ